MAEQVTSYGDPRRPEEWAKLTCGNCGREVLTREMVLTGEGVRCHTCMARLEAAYKAYRAKQSGFSNPPETAAGQANADDQTAPKVINIDVDTTFCARHPKTETLLKCARCGTPICPQCMVYSPVGLRCPDCARIARPTVDTQPRVAPNGQVIERDTGFRTYWRKDPPRYIITPKYYALAILGAILAAVVGGAAWGMLLDASRAVRTSVAGAYLNSIHLFPEIFLGVIVGEAVARFTRDRRGGWLQAIAMAGVLLGVVVALLVLAARAYLQRFGQFPDFGRLWTDTTGAIGGLFQASGTGTFVPLLIGVGLFFAWLRLKK